MNNLSVVIATFNEEKNIKRCLESIKDLSSEIIIVDGGSTDNTVFLAKQFTNSIYKVKNKPMFHANKQYGLEKASKEWTLQLDADEVVTKELKSKIQKIITNNSKVSGYFIPRKNNFLGKFMTKGGLYPDYVLRLFKTKKGHFPQKSVHEQIEVNGETDHLTNPLLHYPYNSVNDYLIKANRYTSLTSNELKKQKVTITPFNTIKYCIFIPMRSFFSIYIRHLGFIDGFYGFVWAFLSSTHYFLAYSKLVNV